MQRDRLNLDGEKEMEEYIDDLLRRMADEETEIWHRAYDEAKSVK